MDKRSILFVICLTLGFFLIHQWLPFGKSPDTGVQKKKEITEEIKKRTASFSELPIVELYKDSQGVNFAEYAIEYEGKYLCLAWSKDLPSFLYAKPRSGGITKVDLRINPTHLNEPVIYSATSDVSFDLPYLSEDGTFDLQLVCFACDELNPVIMLGVFEDGYLNLPVGNLKEDAIALYSFDGRYYPVGIYDSRSKNVRFLQNYLKFRDIVHIDKPAQSQVQGRQGFYVLENEYQQIVFSNYAGAIAEINLPLHSKQHPKSVVNEIEFDRIIREKFPQNDYFPQHPYFTPGGQGEKNGVLGGYYPLLRRTIFDVTGHPKAVIPPRFYAMNLIGDEDLVYKVTRFEKNLIEFEVSLPHRHIIKTFSIPDEAPYVFDVSVQVDGDARNLWMTSGIPEVEIISGSTNANLKYRMTRGKKPSVESIKLPGNQPTEISSVHPDWVSNSNGFLGVIMDPLTETRGGFAAGKIPGTSVITRLTLIDPEYDLYPANKYPGYEVQLPLSSTNQTQSFRVFAGPYEDDVLKAVDAIYSDPLKGYNPDYIAAQSLQGWFSFISEPFAKFLFWLMQIFYKITHSWGFSIILLTIALRLMLYPLNAWSIKSSARMQEIAPLVKKIQAKHKKDPRKAQVEIMTLYRERGVNPLTGCLPMLIQMPFLIGMFYLLKSTFELRGAAFIPGWIDNLAAPDVLFSWNYPIFFIGTQFHLLPFILGAIMFIQQRMTMKLPKDPKDWTDQQRQQKMMGNIMSIVFLVLFYNFPSGLNIYFISSTALGILQQWFMNRKMKTGKTSPVVVLKK